jgi:nucleoside phosphorylase
MRSHSDYRIGWICALPLELAAAEAMLDQIHEPLPNRVEDHNTYILGAISNHNIVIACLPSGVYGTTFATAAAIYMRTTFTSLRFCLLVGIAGGAPTPKADIRLGDVIVSKPMPGYGGVIQYDYGKALVGEFKVTRSLDKPPAVLLTAIARLEASHHLYGTEIPETSAEVLELFGQRSERFLSPGPDKDLLFVAQYKHVECDKGQCDACDRSMLQPRTPRRSTEPGIFYGLVASANQVLRDSTQRDILSRQHGILCFEMKAAGLMDVLPCLVIRGISDYCDSHKNKQWQGYAAVNAAAYAKELLSVIPFHEVTGTIVVLHSTSYARNLTRLEYDQRRTQHHPLGTPSSSSGNRFGFDFSHVTGPPPPEDRSMNATQALEVTSNNPPEPRSRPRLPPYPARGFQGSHDHLHSHFLPAYPPLHGAFYTPYSVFPQFPSTEYHTSVPAAQPNISSPSYKKTRDKQKAHPHTSTRKSTKPISSDSTRATTGRLVIGIDIGTRWDLQALAYCVSYLLTSLITRYTRVAYASLNNHEPKSVSIVDWPNREAETDKVPTVASLDTPRCSWGHDPTLPDASSSLRWLWAILVNDPQFEEVLAARDIFTAKLLKVTRSLGPEGKAGHALANFLGPLWAHTKEAIRADIGKKAFSDATIDVVFALPTVWAEIGREAFRDAVSLAGILDPQSPRRIKLTLMGRTTAAAQAVIFESALSSKELGVSYIVCYAGSTTIVSAPNKAWFVGKLCLMVCTGCSHLHSNRQRRSKEA